MLTIFFAATASSLVYNMHRVAKFKSHVYMFRDIHAVRTWYYDLLDDISIIINKFIADNSITKTIIYGGSLGGYAALYMSAFVDNAICFSYSPQTFNLRNNNVTFSDDITNFYKKTTSSITNLYDFIASKPNNSKRYITWII